MDVPVRMGAEPNMEARIGRPKTEEHGPAQTASAQSARAAAGPRSRKKAFTHSLVLGLVPGLAAFSIATLAFAGAMDSAKAFYNATVNAANAAFNSAKAAAQATHDNTVQQAQNAFDTRMNEISANYCERLSKAIAEFEDCLRDGDCPAVYINIETNEFRPGAYQGLLLPPECRQYIIVPNAPRPIIEPTHEEVP